jgi:chromosome partitioning protein
MKKIAFLSQKGGSGKTTLSVHTAVAATEAGERVVVIDTDPQKSATSWASVRTQDAPIVATVATSELNDVMTAASNDAMTLLIVDAAPHAAPAASRIAQAVDLVVIPVRPTAFDLAAVGNAVEIIKAANARAVFVLSACPFRSPEIAETRAVLAGYGLPVAPMEITDRRAYARAVASGRAVTEFESDGKAAAEVRALWSWIKEQLR